VTIRPNSFRRLVCCITCESELPWDQQYHGMLLCQTCGNKRCPHATDHRLACTNSNEPGQKGSAYE
jgi:hypothetical protein